MSFIKMKQDELHIEALPVMQIAKAIGTPCYIYSRQALEFQWQQFKSILKPYPHQINYAVKANSNIAILNLFAKLGSGFDIVSQGELARVLKAGGSPQNIVFSGVGKSDTEIKKALSLEIGCINIESFSELQHVDMIARTLGRKANVAIRINPDVNSESHPYISTGLKENKFGINIEDALEFIKKAHMMSNIHLKGLAFHIGSQITRLAPFLEALKKVLSLIDTLENFHISITDLNVGGGLGVVYHNETPPTPQEYCEALLKQVKGRDLTLHLEPGRILTANAGILLTQVQYIKEKLHHTPNHYYAIVDAAMNDLLRPSLYSAWQNIITVKNNDKEKKATYDIVGPVCETSDFLGKDRILSLKEKDYLAVLTAGAYGFSMCSNYNSRPKPAEVMVDGNQFFVIREREKIEDLFQSEYLMNI